MKCAMGGGGSKQPHGVFRMVDTGRGYYLFQRQIDPAPWAPISLRELRVPKYRRKLLAMMQGGQRKGWT